MFTRYGTFISYSVLSDMIPDLCELVCMLRHWISEWTQLLLVQGRFSGVPKSEHSSPGDDIGPLFITLVQIMHQHWLAYLHNTLACPSSFES